MSLFPRLPVLGSLALGLAGAGCADKATTDTTSCTHAAQIIGRTICGANGYLLALASPRDTVITYNLPPEVAALVAQAAYQPRTQVALFTPASFVRLKIGYVLLAQAERTPQFCTTTINLAPFNKLTNNGTEIRILCAQQAP
jgi:hypothetical protein